MASGGRREGAGRKVGSVNAMSQRARDEAHKTGELPHEFLLRVCRGEKIGEHEPTFQERLDAAKASAPYFAPRFASATIDLSNRRNRPAAELTNAELEEIVRGPPAEDMTTDELRAEAAQLRQALGISTLAKIVAGRSE
jgi:hypothetical protein